MAVSGVSNNSSSGTTQGATKTLSSGDFLNLMIQQLSQQDPLNPTDSNQLLTQMSQISTLQSNSDMQASLAGLTLQQSIGAGGNLIGKKVEGLDGNGNGLQGTVASVKVVDKKIYLSLDTGDDLPMQNVTKISPTSTSQLTGLASAVPGMQQLLGGAGSNTSTGPSLANVMSMLGSVAH